MPEDSTTMPSENIVPAPTIDKTDEASEAAPKKKSKNKRLKNAERELNKDDDAPAPYLPVRSYDISVGTISVGQERLRVPPPNVELPTSSEVCSEAPPAPTAEGTTASEPSESCRNVLVSRLQPVGISRVTPGATSGSSSSSSAPPKSFRTLRSAQSPKLKLEFLESIGEYGFVADKDIGYGELILRDIPLAILSSQAKYDTQEEEFKQQWLEMDSGARDAFRKLIHRVEGEVKVGVPDGVVGKTGSSEVESEKTEKTENKEDDDNIPPFAEIFRSNGCSIGMLRGNAEGVRTDGPTPDEDWSLPLGVTPEREATVPASGLMIYANRPIKKGEECTIAYLDGVDGETPPLPYEVASDLLERTYGFRLPTIGVKAAAEHDRVFQRVWEKRQKVDELTKEMAAMMLCKPNDGADPRAPVSDPLNDFQIAESVVTATDNLLHTANQANFTTPELYAWAAPRALTAIDMMYRTFNTASKEIRQKNTSIMSAAKIVRFCGEKMPRYARLAYENSEIVYPEEDHSEYMDLMDGN